MLLSVYCAMVDSAEHLVDELLPKRSIRQWVLSVPYPLHFLFATNPWIRWDFPAKLNTSSLNWLTYTPTSVSE